MVIHKGALSQLDIAVLTEPHMKLEIDKSHQDCELTDFRFLFTPEMKIFKNGILRFESYSDGVSYRQLIMESEGNGSSYRAASTSKIENLRLKLDNLKKSKAILSKDNAWVSDLPLQSCVQTQIEEKDRELLKSFKEKLLKCKINGEAKHNDSSVSNMSLTKERKLQKNEKCNTVELLNGNSHSKVAEAKISLNEAEEMDEINWRNLEIKLDKEFRDELESEMEKLEMKESEMRKLEMELTELDLNNSTYYNKCNRSFEIDKNGNLSHCHDSFLEESEESEEDQNTKMISKPFPVDEQVVVSTEVLSKQDVRIVGRVKKVQNPFHHISPGKRPIKPCYKISDMAWCDKMISFLKISDVSDATIIQSIMWPAVSRLNSVVAVAAAGLGKTLGT